VWILSKEFTFEAAHQLPQHDGKCARLHGHSWKAIVFVAGDLLQVTGAKAGMLIDYADIKGIVKPIIDDYLDHHYLNETTGLDDPTSEAIAAWLYRFIKPNLPGLIAVRIDETCTSSCTYAEQGTLPLVFGNEGVMG
jgi:6-pyruvoyltetrahydropterin/6-carboxytetrahydropterin synthase